MAHRLAPEAEADRRCGLRYESVLTRGNHWTRSDFSRAAVFRPGPFVTPLALGSSILLPPQIPATR